MERDLREDGRIGKQLQGTAHQSVRRHDFLVSVHIESVGPSRVLRFFLGEKHDTGNWEVRGRSIYLGQRSNESAYDLKVEFQGGIVNNF